MVDYDVVTPHVLIWNDTRTVNPGITAKSTSTRGIRGVASFAGADTPRTISSSRIMHIRIRVRPVPSILALFLTICPTCFAAGKSLADLEREAREVLADPDNISRRKRIAPVFELAARYVTVGETNKALRIGLVLQRKPVRVRAGG